MTNNNETVKEVTWTTDGDLKCCLIEESAPNTLIEREHNEVLPNMQIRTIKTIVVRLSGSGKKVKID